MRAIALAGVVVGILSFSAGMSSEGTGQGGASGQVDIGASGTDFMKICSNVGDTAGDNPQQRQNEATCLGWVEGFADGFTVHDELLGVPRADRLACIPRNVTNAQMVGVVKKYISGNPDKAHRATRLVASLALARAFSCKRAK